MSDDWGLVKDLMIGDEHLGQKVYQIEQEVSYIVKTQAAKVIEGLCDHIEGSTSFLAVFVCKAMTWALLNKPDIS